VEVAAATTTHALSEFTWPLSRLDDAIELLARRAGHSEATVGAPGVLSPAAASDPHALGRAIERLLSAHGLEVEPHIVRYQEADRLPAPLILRLPDASSLDEPTFHVIGHRQRQYVTILGLDRQWHRVRHASVATALRSPLDGSRQAEVDGLLDTASVPAARRRRVKQALLAEQLADAQVTDAWRIVSEPGSDFLAQLRRAGIGRELATLMLLHALQFALGIVSWALIGRGALEGRTDWGWMTAWALLLATIVPLQLRTTWMQGVLALGVGRLLKERLLTGALRLDSEEIRHQGVGQLLGRVLESSAVESLAVTGGLQAALAVVELVMAASVLWLGAGGASHVVLLVGVVIVAAGVAAAYHRQRQRWSASRLAMTNDLVERVAGHRTRLAQESPARWHAEEDRSLDDYIGRSSALDRWVPVLLVALPRGWLAAAIALLGPAFVSGTSADRLAVSLGGVLLASFALQRFADGLSQLSGAAVAWRQASPSSPRPLTGLQCRPSPRTIRNGKRGQPRSWRSATSATSIRIGRIRYFLAARCRRAPVTVCCCKDAPAAGSRRWRQSSRDCALRAPVSSLSKASTVAPSARMAGGGAW
jgi:ATP-binding cassette subfamily B protein